MVGLAGGGDWGGPGSILGIDTRIETRGPANPDLGIDTRIETRGPAKFAVDAKDHRSTRRPTGAKTTRVLATVQETPPPSMAAPEGSPRTVRKDTF